jgi:hypothetical protein
VPRRCSAPVDANSSQAGRCWSMLVVGRRTVVHPDHRSRSGCCTRCCTVAAVPKFMDRAGGADARTCPRSLHHTVFVISETDPADPERAAANRKTRRVIIREPAQAIAQMPDERIITNAELTSRNRQQPRFEYGLEMQRRLKVVTEKLTAELVIFRKSAEAAAERSEAAARRSEATAATLERLTRWLIGFTVALVVLTVVVIALTAVLAAKG